MDFIFKYNGKLYAILFKQEWTGGAALFQKAWMEQKKLYLQERNLPTLVLRRDLSEQDVYAKIYIFLKLHK